MNPAGSDGPRTLRFTHPDLAPGPAGLGVDDHGRLATVDERAGVRQALLLLLTTRPGERLLRPDYGCELHRLLFAPNDDTTAGLAIHYVTRAVRRWEPRVEVVAVDAGADHQAGALSVTLSYRLRSSGHDDVVALDVPLREGSGS